MQEQSAVTTLLFTDIEGSTRLWEDEPERMQPALARHDAIVRAVVEAHRGVVVKMRGDGVHAVFADPADAVAATLHLQSALKDAAMTGGVALRVRCGLHAGVVQQRDNDYFGSPVNRAARIMDAAHGGQILVSHAIATQVGERLPGGVALRDLGAVRLRDLASPEHIYQVVHPELRQDFPALRSLEATPNNLLQQVTSFIGREREMDDVKELLRKSRLVTLLGTGGLGKTRLSLQVAADVMDGYPDGVWLIELAPITDARLVPQAVASVLRVKEEAGRTMQEALLEHMSNRRLLLILDNCEHLVRSCAELAKQLLQSGAGVSLLASSREPLRVTGETTYSLASLAVPEAQHKSPLAAIVQYDAISLFMDRATAAQSSFRIDEANAGKVAEICRRLDGIPLAIELAAARLRMMSIDKIAERLSDRFRLLTGGDRTALPRQQTLRALIDWSYELLTEPERVLLQRLAVFAGGWTLEAAETVGAGGGLDGGDVFDLLTMLVEKSLVVLEAKGERYHLLETVREYAREYLEKSGETHATRSRHLAFHVDFAERARPRLLGPEQGVWFSRLDLERENILAAHVWCNHAEHGAELGLRLVSAMRRYWMERGILGLGHDVTVEALSREGAQKRNPARCRALFDAGQLSGWAAHYVEAQGYLEESLGIARELGDKPAIVRALQPLVLAFLGQNELRRAREYMEQALALAEEVGSKREIASAQNGLGQIDRLEGRLDAAAVRYEKVLSLGRELNDYELISISLLNLAMVSIGKGSGEEARHLLQQALAVVEKTGSKPTGQSLLEVCSALGAMRSDWSQAAEFFGAGEAQTGKTGLHRDPADEAFLAPLIEYTRGALGPQAFGIAEAVGRSRSYEESIAEARDWLGRPS